VSERNKIRVLLLEPDKLAQDVEIDSSLEGLQSAVGGYIEAFYGLEDPDVCIVCNEEGKLMGLPLNRAVYYEGTRNMLDIIAGPCFICDCSGENFGSLTDDQIQRYGQQFQYPEKFYRDFTGKIIAIPYEPQQEKSNDSLNAKIQSAESKTAVPAENETDKNFHPER